MDMKILEDALLEAMDTLHHTKPYVQDMVGVASAARADIKRVDMAIESLNNAKDKLNIGTLITPPLLEAAGAKHTRLHPTSVFECWWLSIKGTNNTLTVLFDTSENSYTVWLEFPGGSYAFENVQTMEQFAQLYKLLTGKDLA